MEAKLKGSVKIPECWICNDEGTIIYTKKLNGIEYEYLASCNCKKANDYKYNGRDCEIKSYNYIADVNRIVNRIFDTSKIYNNNLNKFIEKYKDNKEVMDELERRGIKLYRG